MFLLKAYIVSSPSNNEQVTFTKAPNGLMPVFDPKFSKFAQKVFISPQKIDYHVGVLEEGEGLLTPKVL
jgi:hypothetical protein